MAIFFLNNVKQLERVSLLNNMKIGFMKLPADIKNVDVNIFMGASLVAQWSRVCLLMQGTRVRALVWEDPTCRGATRPVSHNY